MLDGAGFGNKWEWSVPVTFPKDGGKLWRLQNIRFLNMHIYNFRVLKEHLAYRRYTHTMTINNMNGPSFAPDWFQLCSAVIKKSYCGRTVYRVVTV
jgi:hypothetical protein